jgi:alpha-glucan,water dikinase
MRDVNRTRDLLFLDISLELYLRQLVEKIIHLNLEFQYYVTEITAIIRNILFTYKFEEFQFCYDDWVNIAEPLKNSLNDNENPLKIKSVGDRFSRCLAHIIDYYNVNLDPKAKYLGQAFNADKYAVDLFTEEIIRGSVFFALSMLLKKIEPIIRKYAHLSPWQIISPGKNTNKTYYGHVTFVKNLKEVQFKSYEKKTILLTENVGGNEEIPVNVTCLIIVLSRDYPDMLSHVSVRARNLGVPFIVCFEDNLSNDLIQLENKDICIKISNSSNIEFNEVVVNNKDKYKEDSEKEKEHKIQSVKIEEGFPEIFLELEEFSKSYLGAKANNTKVVFGNLPEWVKYPESFAIPFNVCEYFLSLIENSTIKEELNVRILYYLEKYQFFIKFRK